MKVENRRTDLPSWRLQYTLTLTVTVVLFCVPCALIGLVLFIEARTLANTGHVAEAEDQREQAKYWTICAVFFGVVLLLLCIILPIVFFVINNAS